MRAAHGKLFVIILIAAVFGGVVSRTTSAQQGPAASQTAAKYPSDIHPDSRARMPAAKREDFNNDEEKQAFDRIVGRDNTVPTNATGIRLHFPVVAEAYRAANTWLRDKAGLEPRYQELAILVATRESNCAVEWIGHERSALAAGVPQDVVDIIKFKKDTKGLGEKEDAVIRLGREMHRDPKVSSKTFADVTRLFGQRDTLTMISLIVHYSASGMLLRAYDVQLAPDQKYPFPTP